MRMHSCSMVFGFFMLSFSNKSVDASACPVFLTCLRLASLRYEYDYKYTCKFASCIKSNADTDGSTEI